MAETKNLSNGAVGRYAGLMLARLPHLAAAGAMALGLLVLVGWQFGIEGFKRIMPEFVAMNPATAVGFIVGGAALGIYALYPAGRTRAMRVARGLAIAMAALGAAKLIAYVGGPDFRLDQILFNHQLATGGPAHAGQGVGEVLVNRMAPNTALLFLLMGAALLGARMDRVWLRRGAKVVAFLTALAAVVAAIGYFNGVTRLYRPTALIPIALHTVMGFLMLSAGILTLGMTRAGGEVGLSEGAGERETVPLEKKITIGFAVALFLLAVIGVVSYASIQNFTEAGALTEHGRHVTASIDKCWVLLAEAEIAGRGYALTGDGKFLISLDSAAANADAFLGELGALTANDARESEETQRLDPLVTGEFALLQEMAAQRKAGGDASVQQLLDAGEGKQIRDDIRDTFAALRTTEDDLQSGSSRATQQSSRVTTVVITMGSLLAFALVGISGWVIRRDLIDRGQMERELKNARHAAVEANESKSRFLANMSHEIRTPMAAIIGFADLILQPEQTASDRLDYINTIRRNGEHLLTIINDVLDLSKIEAGKFQIDPVECCPCKVLSDVASLMRVRAVEKLIRLEVKNEGVVPATIRTDPARLRQILINLVGNAIKFTEEGWVRLIMRLEEPEGGGGGAGRLRFDVIDTGIGMSREQMGKLFQPFVQADGSTTRRFGGTGLGLTICKRLAEMLGGKIEIDSSPGRGSTFTLTIDVGNLEGVKRLQNCREALAGVEKHHENRPAVALQGRILLVDDGQDNRRLLSVYLREAGAEVSLAENGKIGCDEALAAAANGEAFGVILMDMQMPELDGYGATAKLRSKGYQGTIIALTAHAMAEDRAKCLDVGCTDYLSKPVRRGDLLAMVARYLGAATGAGGGQAVETPAQAAAEQAAAAGGRTLIRSDMNDEGLRPFLTAYIEALPERIGEIESCLAQRKMAELSVKAHNLRGTGGMYGLMPITDAAARVETLISEQAAVDSIEREVRNLIETIERVEGFNSAKSATAAQQPQPPEIAQWTIAMATILVIDDEAVIREPIAASLRAHGHAVQCAGDAKTALAYAKAEQPDLVLLDVRMPGLDGIAVLRRLRDQPTTAQVPVILLTNAAEKSVILEAAKVGVQGYILKSAFSLKELIERVNRFTNGQAACAVSSTDDSRQDAGDTRQAANGVPVVDGPSGPAAGTAKSLAAQIPDKSATKPPKNTSPGRTKTTAAALGALPQLLTREQSIGRVKETNEGQPLNGIVAQVIAMAVAPPGDMGELGALLGRDPALAARVLEIANSPAFATGGKTASNLAEAVRQVGGAAIRDLAAAVGLFDALRRQTAGSPCPLRCWRHSLAVAHLCRHLAAMNQPERAGLAYLMGLCHDLGEILLQTEFAEEYGQVLAAQAKTGKPPGEVENAMLGLRRADLTDMLLVHLGLPPALRAPIEAFHRQSQARGELSNPLGRILRMADLYANGIMLAADGSSPVAFLGITECRKSVDQDHPPAPDEEHLRSAMMVLTAMLARLAPEQLIKGLDPIHPRTAATLWVARHPAISKWDPLAAALRAMAAEVTVEDHLPTIQEFGQRTHLVVLAPTAGARGFTAAAIEEAAGHLPPKTKKWWAIGQRDAGNRERAGLSPTPLPVTLDQLAGLLAGT